MHKQKVQAKANSKIQIKENTLKPGLSKAVANTKSMVDLKEEKNNLRVAIKPGLKKPKANRRKSAKNAKFSKTKSKTKCVINQTIKTEEIKQSDVLPKKHFSRLTQTENETKILKPCCSLLQNQKCATELTCPYLHSDFPCKYYYLSLPCPQGRNCQFMHNGPLAPILMDALRTHILDLLSCQPSSNEIYFIEQMNQIDNIYQKLLSFQKNQQDADGENVAVLDDCDEVKEVLIEHSNGFNKFINDASRETLINYDLKSCYDTPKGQALTTTAPGRNLDDLYESFKEKNDLLEQIDQKLKNLKTISNLTSDEKIIELQKIYELLKEQENLLSKYENLNSSKVTREVLPNIANNPLQSNDYNDQANFVLVQPDIDLDEIQPLLSQEIIGMEDNEILPHKKGIEIISIENISPNKTDINTKMNLSDQTVSNYKHLSPVNNKNEVPIEIYNFSNEANELHFENQSEEFKDCNLFQNLNTYIQHQSIARDSQETVEMMNDNKNATIDSIGNPVTKEYNEENAIVPLNENVELNLNSQEKEFIEDNDLDSSQIENIVSPLYENIISPKSSTNQESFLRNHIRLRSHTHHDINEQSMPLNTIEKQEKTNIKRRRLRLPKSNLKAIQKSYNECQINGDIINKLIESEESKDKNNKIGTILEDTSVPLTQNVVLSRFMKKTRAKQEKNCQGNQSTNNKANNKDLYENIENNMCASDNDITVQTTQTSDNSIKSLNSSQEVLIIEDDSDSDSARLTNKILPSNETHSSTEQSTNSFFKKVLSATNGVIDNTNLKGSVSFKNLTSSHTSSPLIEIEQKFNLRHPRVVLTKLKHPTLKKTDLKEMAADSTTSSILSDKKNATKRQSLSSDDLDSFVIENKYSKTEISLNIETNSEEHGDYDFDSDTDKLSIEDAINTSIAANEQQNAFESSLTEETKTLKNRDNQAQEIESDLHQQQIKNVSNKSDLQMQSQIQQQHKQKEMLIHNLHQQKRVDTKTIASCLITNKNVEHEDLDLEEDDDDDNKRQCSNVEHEEVDMQQKSHSIQSVDKFEKTPRSSQENNVSENEENIEYSKYASFYNKLSTNNAKYQIKFEDSSISITPIASPTYGDDDAIASPSPAMEESNVLMCTEIDGRLTYPPIPYILYEIDLEKNNIGRPLNIDKLKKSIGLDPRIFDSSSTVKKQMLTFHKPKAPTPIESVPVSSLKTNTKTAPMLLHNDPRVRSSKVETPSSIYEKALACYNVNAATTSPYINTDMPSPINALSLPLDYHTPQTIYPQQQSPNMFLYGCLQRSPWYQSLMSTMKIQINQSISQLVRALNIFHRERLLNPTAVFDVFKIDCAGELMEIMRNLDIFIDSNGVINDQRDLPSFAGRSCVNTMPVKATYSFIQQFLTPNTHCASMTTTSSSYNASSGGSKMNSLNIMEPFVSCYVKAPDAVQNSQDNDICSIHTARNNDNNNCNCNCKCKVEHYNNNNNSNNNNNRNYNQDDRRYNHFKKPYDNSNNNKGNNNNYQHRSNQRSYNHNNNNNPRFTKPSEFQKRSSTSPPNSPTESNANDNSRNYSGGGGGGGGGHGRGGRFNNNFKKRFNNYNNNTNKNFSTGDNDNHQSNQSFLNSPKKSPPTSSYKQKNESPQGSPIRNSPVKPNTTDIEEEECWD